MNRKKLDDVLVLVNQKINVDGFDCLEVEWEARDRILRLYIGKAGDTIKLSDCVAVNNLLKECVGLDDAIEGSYNLEVSSPGLNRPLRLIKSYRDAVGEIVKLNLREGGLKKAIVGRLVDVTESEIVLETKEGRRAVSFDSVFKAQVVHDHPSL